MLQFGLTRDNNVILRRKTDKRNKSPPLALEIKYAPGTLGARGFSHAVLAFGYFRFRSNPATRKKPLVPRVAPQALIQGFTVFTWLRFLWLGFSHTTKEFISAVTHITSIRRTTWVGPCAPFSVTSL